MFTLPLFAAIFRIYRISPPLRANFFTGQAGLRLFFSHLSDLRQQPEKLIRRQRQYPEHQVRHHLRISPDPDMLAAKVVLQPPVRPFRLAALFVTLRLGLRELDLLATVRGAAWMVACTP